MQFDKTIVRSLVDIPNEISMIISSVVGCNLKCYKCHSWNHIVNHKAETISEIEIIEKIKLNGFMFDNIILSGGEIMMNNIDELINFISEIKKIFDGKVIIYTNGFYYNNIKKLYNIDLVDDWYVDIKFPYNINFTEELYLKYKSIVGIDYRFYDVHRAMNTIKLLKDYHFRTVKYPNFSYELLNGINDIVEKYNLNHTFNEFIEV